MDIDRYIASHEPSWIRLEELTARARRGVRRLGPADYVWHDGTTEARGDAAALAATLDRRGFWLAADGLPKGSLQEPTLELFKRAGFNIVVSSRSYRPTVDDDELELRLLRAQEIGRYVDHGYLDCGITGKDWIAENGADVEVITDLRYSKATSKPTRWVLVVPEDSPIKTVKDLQGKRIATEAVGLTQRYLEAHGVKAEVEFSWGATEVKVPELVDAIVDITETGSSLRANKLRIVDTLMESYPQFVSSRPAANGAMMNMNIHGMILNTCCCTGSVACGFRRNCRNIVMPRISASGPRASSDGGASRVASRGLMRALLSTGGSCWCRWPGRASAWPTSLATTHRTVRST